MQIRGKLQKLTLISVKKYKIMGAVLEGRGVKRGMIRGHWESKGGNVRFDPPKITPRSYIF